MTTTSPPRAARPLLPRPKTARDQYWRRQGAKELLWVLLPVTLGLGWFFPVLGLGILICMGASIGVAFVRGRAWCDVCPRGTFFDVVMARVAGGRPVPGWLRHTGTRLAVLVFVMAMMGLRLAPVWGDAAAMGRVLLSLLAVTTLVGIVLALLYTPRGWCAICPMGSMASWIGKRKAPLQIAADACTTCGTCARACPMALDPAAFREAGRMQHGDCLKCLRCVASCPKHALSFTPGNRP